MYVGGSGEGNYTKIQDAIDDASGGDTVFVYNGTYVENVVIDKSINLIGEDKNTTVIDGSGLEGVVYITSNLTNIMGFTIKNAGRSRYEVGISVYGDNFSIMDCYLIDNDFGIWLFESDNSTISNVALSSNRDSIRVGDWNEDTVANYVKIFNNHILDSHHGIEIIDGCLEPNVYNNYIADCFCGISVYCDYATIEYNTLKNNSEPIFLSSSRGTIIKYNKMNSNRLGSIKVDYCKDIIISKNELLNCGISIFGHGIENFDHYISSDNIVNGKPLYYFFNEDIEIDGWEIGQLILTKCSGIVANINISHTSTAIQLAHCSNVTICNSSLNYNGRGISLIYSNDNNIKYNEMSNNTGIGCHLNIISSKNRVIKNSCSWNDWGIFVEDNNNMIMGNTVNRNNIHGIYLDSASYNTITNNKIINSKYGLDIGYSNNNTVTRNIIKSNTEYGIRITPSYDSNNNIIYHNNFENNINSALDKGSNTWDNGYPSGGNYWDDYNGTDTDGDGIGDTPYNISGGDNQDRYPLIEPYNNEIESFFGTIGPICPFLNFAEIELIDGNESQIRKIEKMLNNRILHFIIPRFIFINVTDLDFKVSYTKKIPKKIPFFWKFAYLTFSEEYRNQILIDEPHIVTVKGLNGQFGIVRGKPIILFPPYFIFEGDFEEVNIEYLNRV